MSDEIRRWALDSAARQGELAVSFIETLGGRVAADDELATIYAKGAASAALYFLGRENS